MNFKLPIYNTLLPGIFKIPIPENWLRYLNRIYQEMGTKLGVTIFIDAFAGETELRYEIVRNNEFESCQQCLIQLHENYNSDEYDRMCQGDEYKFPFPIHWQEISPGYEVSDLHWYEKIIDKRNSN